MQRFTYLILIIATSSILFSCNQGKVKRLEEEKTALEAERVRQDSILNEYLSTFNEFESNLQAIKEKENLIQMGASNPEYQQEGKDAIIADIQAINDLLDQNRMIIEELTAKAEKAEGASSQLRRTISSLKGRLAESDAQVTTLKEQLAELNFRVEDLNGRIDTLSRERNMLVEQSEEQIERITRQEDSLNTQYEELKEQETALNTAYYVTGDTRELKDKQVITKEGGFIGLGGAKKLAEDFNQTAFNRIDIREMKEIPVESKKADLLTVHPVGTYEFIDKDDDKVVDVLAIKDPERFWKTSKYLVVMTK